MTGKKKGRRKQSQLSEKEKRKIFTKGKETPTLGELGERREKGGNGRTIRRPAI